jgi:arylsulfatase A-like enzyme
VNAGTVETNNGHPHNGPLRAGKGSAYEGGTRVPFIVRWPGRVAPGVSGQLVCHADMLASFAALAGVAIPAEAGPDSFNVLPALMGGLVERSCRDHLVEHGNVLALRQGEWKLIPAAGAAGDAKGGRKGKGKRGTGPEAQLFNLAQDIGETNNVAAANPDRVKAMGELLERVKSHGRSRAPQRGSLRWTKIPFLFATMTSGRPSPLRSAASTCVPTPELSSIR